MGCEVCQAVCPQNAQLAKRIPGEAEQAAFALPRLIAGDAAAARSLVGRNLTGNGKLTAEAICFAARAGLHEAEIRYRAHGFPVPGGKKGGSMGFRTVFHQKIIVL